MFGVILCVGVLARHMSGVQVFLCMAREYQESVSVLPATDHQSPVSSITGRSLTHAEIEAREESVSSDWNI